MSNNFTNLTDPYPNILKYSEYAVCSFPKNINTINSLNIMYIKKNHKMISKLKPILKYVDHLIFLSFSGSDVDKYLDRSLIISHTNAI